MSTSRAHTSSALVLCGIGLGVAAIAALIAVIYNREPRAPGMKTVSSITMDQTQKNLLDTYIQKALAIHAQYRAHTLTAAQAKQAALALTVPSVLKDRHLAWIFALDKNDAAACDALMRDYTLLGVLK